MAEKGVKEQVLAMERLPSIHREKFFIPALYPHIRMGLFNKVMECSS